MARTKLNQRSANRVAVPMGATGGRTPPSAMTVALLVTCILAAVWAAAMLTPYGRMAYVYVFAYAEYYMGVLTLVSLSITVMIGLVATDRLVLSIRQRVLLQSAHRTTGVIAILALGLHVATKLSIGHVRVVDVFVPFLAPYNTLYIGLGSIAGGMLVSVLWTGLARARFAGRGKPWMWRSLHSVAYLSWPIALVHGLSAGRTAATWVIVSYVVCVLFVLVGLAVRLSVSLNRRKDFSSTSTGALKPVGAVAASATPRLTRRRPEVVPPAPVPTWRPAAAVAIAAAPAVVEPDPSSGTDTRPFRDPGVAGAGSRSFRDAEPDTYRGGAELEPVRPAARRRADPEDDPRYADDAAPRRGGQADNPSRYDVPRHEGGPRYDDRRPAAARYDDPRYDDHQADDHRSGGRRADDRRRDDRRTDDRYDRHGYEAAGYTTAGYDAADYESAGYDARGYDARGQEGRDRRAYDIEDRADQSRGYQERDARTRRFAAADHRPDGRGRDAGPRYDTDPRFDVTSRYDAGDRDAAARFDAGSRYDGRDRDADPRYDDRDEHVGRRRSRSRRDDRDARDDREVRDTPREEVARYRGGRELTSTPHRAEPEPVSRGRRRALQEAGDQPGRAYAEPWREEPPRPRSRAASDPPPARGRARAADTGRHSRSEFVDLADPNYLPADDTPTLVDIAARREMRAGRTESVRSGGRSSRRGAGRGRAVDELSDESYWRELRGEAQ